MFSVSKLKRQTIGGVFEKTSQSLFAVKEGYEICIPLFYFPNLSKKC